jgi:hypothetical protein
VPVQYAVETDAGFIVREDGFDKEWFAFFPQLPSDFIHGYFGLPVKRSISLGKASLFQPEEFGEVFWLGWKLIFVEDLPDQVFDIFLVIVRREWVEEKPMSKGVRAFFEPWFLR